MGTKHLGLISAATFAAVLLAHAPVVRADPLTKAAALAACEKAQFGPETPYGETAAEKQAKKLTFQWNCKAMVEGKVSEAFEKYVSKDFCDHSHLVTRGQKDCGNYAETEQSFERMAKQFGGGPTIEVPVLATVDGDMVVHYGEGVDIFRVKDGKLTDHWDASPPAEISIDAHAPGFTDWVLGDRKGPPPMVKSATPKGVVVDRALMTAVNTGPLTPYAETAKESDAKRTVFRWNFMAIVQGKPKEAAEQFVAANFCDHSHMVTRAKKDCGTREELLAGPLGQAKAVKVGDRIELPMLATVSGEMVTMYGAGVDIFRVVDGKITDHWDASPGKALTLKAHDVNVVEDMIKVLRGEQMRRDPFGGGAPPAGAAPGAGPPPAN
ncbi:MAG: hypothetical protein QM718_12945 [Steroidobacteraceae bacterium]